LVQAEELESQIARDPCGNYVSVRRLPIPGEKRRKKGKGAKRADNRKEKAIGKEHVFSPRNDSLVTY
jgi:hypothetical protein